MMFMFMFSSNYMNSKFDFLKTDFSRTFDTLKDYDVLQKVPWWL